MSPSPNHTSYDEVPYPSYPFAQTHPDHLATIATLLGLDPPPPERCRVLELGCAGGGNLIPMALGLPHSTFLGIDLSREQIAEGQKTIAALGLKNIELRQLSILDVETRFGSFDYILCHGVYSWVPAAVQEKILAVCARHLTPGGIGYVSYNTYPGWHVRGLVRDMLYYHASRFATEPPARRVGRVRALLDFLAGSAVESDPTYRALLREQQRLFQKSSDAYLFHEHLEECNVPLWFLQFCERLAEHGLRYLGEAEFHSMVPGVCFTPAVGEQLDALTTNLVEQEQYMDFLRNRSFRQTLVCHEHARPTYEIRPSRLRGLHVAAHLWPESQDDLASEAPVKFLGQDELSLTVADPLVKAALVCLGEVWPQMLPFDALPSLARTHLGHAVADDSVQIRQDAQTLGMALLTAHAGGGESLVGFSLRPPAFADKVSERPIASPLARLQAVEAGWVTSLRHQVVSLSPFDGHLLPLLDGTRDRSELVEALVERFRDGKLHISQEEVAVTDTDRARGILGEVLNQQLPKLAKAALLVA